MVKIEGRWASQFYSGIFGHFKLDISRCVCTFFYEGIYRNDEEATFDIEIYTTKQESADDQMRIIVRTEVLNDTQQFQLGLFKQNDNDWNGRYTTIFPFDYGILY